MVVNSEHNVVFLHIPKNGGMTFHSILKRNFDKQSTFSIKLIRKDKFNTHEFKQLPADRREEIRLLKGHLQFGLHKYLDGPSKYITFLRNPTSRIRSYYNYVRSQPEHRLYPEIAEKQLSFQDFVERIDDWDIHNAQVRLISGIDDAPELMLEKALENVERYFPIVGFLENYDQSLVLLQHYYNLKFPYYILQNKTESKRKTKITPEAHSLLKEKNEADIKLYGELELRFQKQIKSFGKVKMKRELRKLDLVNKVLNTPLSKHVIQLVK